MRSRSPRGSPFEISLSRCQSQLSAPSQLSDHNARKKATIFMVGLFAPTEELFPLMVKPWLAGVLSLVHSMEGFMPCLARSSQPKHTSVMKRPESTPATLQNSRVLLRRFLFRALCRAVRVSHSCIFNDSKHAASVCLGTVQTRANVELGLACQRLLLQIQLMLRFTRQHICSHAQNLGNECAGQRLVPLD